MGVKEKQTGQSASSNNPFDGRTSVFQHRNRSSGRKIELISRYSPLKRGNCQHSCKCTILGCMKKVKRKHTRYSWQGTVTYRRSLPNQALALKEMSGQGQLQNVSRGGLCLLTNQRLNPREFLAITVPLHRPHLVIPTLAYVQWTRPVRGTTRYAAGLSFLV